MREGGRLVTIVNLERIRSARHVDAQVLYVRPDGRQLAALSQLVEEGHLTVHLDQVFPLTLAKQALMRLETRHHQGKIVLSLEA